MNTRTQSLIALLIICSLLTACATSGSQQGGTSRNPCFDRSNDPTFHPQTSFLQTAILNPLANIGGTLLATAAANYSQHYTGKLNKLLTKLVTPKNKKRKQNNSNQDNFPQDFSNQFPQDNQDFNQGFSGAQDQFPNDQGFIEQDQFPTDQNFDNQEFSAGVDEEFQDGVDPNAQGDIQSRGAPRQGPHARFGSEDPCAPERPDQPYSDPNMPHQGQPYDQDPYAQQGQPYGQDPYNQGGQPYDQDPYAQQGQPYGQDPYNQSGQPYDQDPYAQQGQPYGQDPYNQSGQPYDQDPYAQPGQNYPADPYAQPVNQQGMEPVGLEVVLLKKTIRNGVSTVIPIKDGDVLKDGRGNAKAGEKFRIMFRPNSKSYVYVIAIDGSGWAQGIFPPATSPLANPVEPGKEYILPEGNNWFSLDQYRGIETLFFVASPNQRNDIEEILQSITGLERPATEKPQQVTKVAMVPYGVGAARPSSQPFTLATGSASNQTIMPTSYFAQKAGEDLRLTRWFRHE